MSPLGCLRKGHGRFDLPQFLNSSIRDVMSYWALVRPIWDKVDLRGRAESFLNQYDELPEAPRLLFAAHWARSEIGNGGFAQLFSNSTGVLAPEAVHAFVALGMPRVADALTRAMALLGDSYPRGRSARQKALQGFRRRDASAGARSFDALEDEFFLLIDSENGGFDAAADQFAAGQGT